MPSDIQRRILSSALNHVNAYSFTRPAIQRGIVEAVPSLDPMHNAEVSDSSSRESATQHQHQLDDLTSASNDSILVNLFGPGLAPERALVQAWSEEGLKCMSCSERATVEGAEGTAIRARGRVAGRGGKEEEINALRDVLARRLKYTSESAGEHVVQAYALLASSSNTTSLTLPPIPKRFQPLLNAFKESLRPLPAYHAPSASDHIAGTVHSVSADSSASTESQTRPQIKQPYIPLPGIHILPILAYGFQIADEAIHAVRAGPSATTDGRVQQATFDKIPEGGGSDWYLRRLGLGLIYLHAESWLLYPRPSVANLPARASISSHNTTTSPSPQPTMTTSSNDELLVTALNQLDTSLSRYETILEAGERFGEVKKDLGQFAGFVYKSWGGLFRSRGWIR